jgi:ribosomal subunit interface protein
MNVQISYKISKTPDLEKLINQQVEKLGRYLQVFRPDAMHLKGSVEENSRHGFDVSLNLRLPSGQLAAQESSATAIAAIKAGFEELTEQVKKHKDLLRKQHQRSPRRGAKRPVETVPFEDTVAAMKPPQISAGDVVSYVNVNLPRLKRFIQRELTHRENEGQFAADQIEVEDVVSEAISNALGDQPDKPELMKLEPWIHRLAIQAINSLASDGHGDDDVPLERSRGVQNVQASDEARLQFHQPDEKLFEENVIADPVSKNPEELAAQHEQIDLIETTLGDAGRKEREAFILYTVEGFTLEEIADITNRTVEEVRAAVRKAGEHLQRALPMKDPLKDRLVEYSKSA